MSITAIVLLVVSAGTHAGWNLLGKRSNSNAASFLAAAGMGTLILLPFPLFFARAVPSFRPAVWALIVTTGAFQAFYYRSLAAGYRTGDMSLVYPVARSTPTVLVAIFAVLVGRADRLTALAFLGVALIAGGGYLLPMTHFRDFSPGKYLTPALAFALCAAVGTAGYSIVDARALSLLRGDMQIGLPVWQVTGLYAFFEGVSSAFWLAVYVFLVPSERRRFMLLGKPGGNTVRDAAFMGAGIYLTYTIVLVSMAFVRDVSYVVAFRQLSVPVGVVLSALVLREKLHAPKATGALLMFAGVVLVGVG